MVTQGGIDGVSIWLMVMCHRLLGWSAGEEAKKEMRKEGFYFGGWKGRDYGEYNWEDNDDTGLRYGAIGFCTMQYSLSKVEIECWIIHF